MTAAAVTDPVPVPGQLAFMELRIVGRLAMEGEKARLAGDLDTCRSRFEDLRYYVRAIDGTGSDR